MNVRVNGENRDLGANSTVADLISEMGRAETSLGVAVAVNGEVVPRSAWSARRLSEGDRVEVLDAVSGG